MKDIREIYRTQSLCPVCLTRLPAVYEREGDGVYIRKRCPEHGESRTLFWRDADMYESWMAQGIHAPKATAGKPVRLGCPYDCGICAEHRSGTCTAVLEITGRCNLNCPVCFASAGGGEDLPKEAVGRMYAAALAANPHCSVQLSGGEPTVRDDLPELVRMGKGMGVNHLQINTNGVRIASDLDYLNALREAGADLVYLQFDGTDDSIYKRTRGLELLEVKRRAVENCEKAGIGVVLVPVVARGLNLDNVGEMVRFAVERIPTVKGVHFQPLSYFGRYPGKAPRDEERCGLCDVINALEEQCGGAVRREHFVPRKQFDPHCDFSATYFLNEDGELAALSHFEQNKGDDERTDFVRRTNEFTGKRWRMREQRAQQPDTPLGRFAMRLTTHSFVLSGMGFQDAWNVDLGRLNGCCVHVVTPAGELVPFCAYHLTAADGSRLYGRRGSASPITEG